MERGLPADHTTIWRWVQRYAPERNKRCRRELKPINGSWRVDETHIYRGEVVLYYPGKLPTAPEDDLYLALAQVVENCNLSSGISRLAEAIERHDPECAEFYLGLAEAWRSSGQLEKALPLYREAIRRNPKFVFGLRKHGSGLRLSGQYAEAADVLKRAAAAAADDAYTWQELGLALRAQGKTPDAVAALQKAVALDPDMPEPHNSLGVVWLAGGQQARAETAFREAIRLQPDYVEAHNNLVNLLSGTGDLQQARYHLELALRLRPEDAAILQLRDGAQAGAAFRRSAATGGGVPAGRSRTR
jgi:tetratricopeptide (TPR) repeat protein